MWSVKAAASSEESTENYHLSFQFPLDKWRVFFQLIVLGLRPTTVLVQSHCSHLQQQLLSVLRLTHCALLAKKQKTYRHS